MWRRWREQRRRKRRKSHTVPDTAADRYADANTEPDPDRCRDADADADAGHIPHFGHIPNTDTDGIAVAIPDTYRIPYSGPHADANTVADTDPYRDADHRSHADTGGYGVRRPVQ